MKPLENVWSGLLQRRLLPVAILLLAALAAIPFVLAKDPEPIAPPPPPAAEKAPTAADAAADPVVSLVADGERAQRRRVLGVRKNPFEPAKAPKAEATAAPSQAQVQGAPDTGSAGGKPVTGTGGSPAGGSGGAPSAPVSPVAPVAPVGPEAEKQPAYEMYSLTVRFGSSEAGSLDKLNLPRLKALPSAEDPVLVYLGPGKGAKTAIFMVDEGVEAQGDASCKPSPDNCETLHMRVGDTEFLDVTDEDGGVGAQYQLDLLKIKTSKTADAAKAGEARAKASEAGRKVLRARQAASGPLRYRYDAKSGTVRKIPKRAYKALMAKSARIAMGVAGGF